MLHAPAVAIGNPDRGGHLRLVDIQSRDSLEESVKHLLRHTHLPSIESVLIARRAPLSRVKESARFGALALVR
jgi:hypothetical protein